MATLKAISLRLKSVKNIQKITKSMKMVSAAKYSRAERDLKEARPLGEGCQVFFEKIDITKSTIEINSDKQKLVIAITSDRGLCGPVHAQVSKAVKAELKNSPDPTKIVCVGDKSRALLQGTLSDKIVLVVNEIGRLPPNFLDASEIALYTKKYNFTFGKIIYNRFLSVISNSLSQLNFFTENAIRNAPKSSVYNSLDSDVLNSYLEFSFATLLFYTLKENACSELASRMSAMDNASKNAGDMINMLTLRFNRTRQAAITRELTEIISGASALN